MAKILPIWKKFVALNLLFNFAEPSINLALNKATRQSSNWRSTQYLSGNAVDGNTVQNFHQGTCTHTAMNKGEASWLVYLGKVYQIKRITIYYRNEQGIPNKQRLNGYIIHINAWACYRDPIDVLPSTLTPAHNCLYKGSQVAMTVRRQSGVTYPNYDGQGAIINLCELEVYGCDIGYYGNGNCDTACGVGCNNGECDPDDGTCTCKTGWKGNKCNQLSCPTGQYGHPCQLCPFGCLNDVCEDIDGHCVDGCKPGAHSSQCDQQCPGNCAGGTCNQDTGNCNGCKPDFHGSKCSQPCPENCASGICNQDTGNCNACVSGYHNTDCSLICPTGCKNNNCDQNGGDCSDGCVGFLTGKKCSECQTGYYGTTACLPCPNGCLNNNCNAKDGYCTGCKNTFYGQHCNLTCPLNCRTESCNIVSGHCDKCKPRFHGTYCNLTCSVNCFNGICDQDTGECDLGCTHGFYGIYCFLKCSTGCQTSNCNQINGDCVGGCIEGFTNNKCTACVDGKHGVHCNKTCPATCKANVCHRYNGTCVNGCIHKNLISSTCNECKTGYFGKNCTSRCPKNCFNCEKETGHCHACDGNYFGPTCIVCQQGYYGSSCQMPCPSSCRDGECDPRIGYCTRGCIDGMYGIFCNVSCQTNCSLNKCHQMNGECETIKCVCESGTCSSIAGPVVGSVFATLTLVCVVLAVIFMIRRFRTKQESTNYENATPKRNVGNTTEKTYEELKKSSIYTNDAFYESMTGTAAESTEQNDDITQNYETP